MGTARGLVLWFTVGGLTVLRYRHLVVTRSFTVGVHTDESSKRRLN